MALRPVPEFPEELPRTATDDEILQWSLSYLRHAPLSLAVREINRLIAFQSVSGSKGPVLDVGCGDGFWWTVRRDEREIYGIDISVGEIMQARERIAAEVSDISRRRPFPDITFEEMIGNCSLEHVPDIDAALSNLRRSASDRARLIMFVPTPRWAYQGHLQSLLLKRAPRVAMAVSGAFNGFFQHWHLYDAKVWQRLLEQNGWRVESTQGLGSTRSEFLFRLFLPPSFIEFVFKKVTGFYPARLAKHFPDSWFAPVARLLRWGVSNPIVAADSPHAYEYVIVARAASPSP